MSRALVLAWALGGANLGAAETVLHPTADTTLHERFPEANLGAHFDFAAGTIRDGQRTRALLRFDLREAVPAEATLLSATLELEVTRAPSSGGVASVFQVHRALRAWSEGGKTSATGEPASEGESTWHSARHPSQGWAQPGGAAGLDYAAEPSGQVRVAGLGRYSLASGPALVEDVRAWIQRPQENHGWFLIGDAEGVPETARRFAAREDAERGPTLTLTYALGTNTLRIAELSPTAKGLATLSWTGGMGPFQVQRRDALEVGEWRNVGEPVPNSPAKLELGSAFGFLRVIGSELMFPTNPPTNGGTNLPPVDPPDPPDTHETVEYEVTFHSDWSRPTHPQDFPGGAHWSPLVGGTHKSAVVFWEEGREASRGIEDVAELGSVVALRSEIAAAVTQGTAFGSFTRPGSISPDGTVSTTFRMHRDYPLVTLVTMIAPSPDWFTGVHGLPLWENGGWVREKTVVLDLWDAGTDSGATYTSRDADTQPREPIRLIRGFPALVDGRLVPFGTFTFRQLAPPAP